MVSYKKKDILNLSFEDYQANKETVIEDFELVCKFLLSQEVFRKRNMCYSIQLIPLCGYIGVC